MIVVEQEGRESVEEEGNIALELMLAAGSDRQGQDQAILRSHPSQASDRVLVLDSRRGHADDDDDDDCLGLCFELHFFKNLTYEWYLVDKYTRVLSYNGPTTRDHSGYILEARCTVICFTDWSPDWPAARDCLADFWQDMSNC